MFELIKPFWPLIWRAALVVVVAVFCYWTWGHYVKDPYIAEGVAIEHVKTEAAEAANKTLAADVEVLRTKVAEQNSQIAALAADEAAAKIAVAKARAALKKMENDTKTEIERLREIAASPPAANKETDCEDATKLFDSAVGRVRD